MAKRSPRKSRGEAKAPIHANGRKAALECLDVMMARPKNIAALEKAFQEAFDAQPLTFFTDIVAPLLPKSVMMDMGGSEERRPVRIEMSIDEQDS